MVLVEDFLGSGVVGNAITSSQLYGPEFTRATLQLNTLDRIWPNKPRIDIIKVDIEGQETNFCASASVSYRNQSLASGASPHRC
jgi:hypothetical protein